MPCLFASETCEGQQQQPLSKAELAGLAEKARGNTQQFSTCCLTFHRFVSLDQSRIDTQHCRASSCWDAEGKGSQKMDWNQKHHLGTEIIPFDLSL
uniref:Uncharacterized protein n=1 Tax=Corvus moneduloides TaxID=1196302 RepID=A0A8C3ED00_CORMO